MANVHATKQRPPKPYPEFPLFAHNNGQWCRKIAGKLYSFGSWDDPDAALKKHGEEYAYRKQGIEPPVEFNGWRVGDLVNKWLEVLEDRLSDGEIVQHTFDACHRVGALIVHHIDRDKAVDSLTPDDFRAFRSAMLKEHSLVTVKANMTRVRQVFKFAFDERLISKPVFYGQGFKAPTKTALRKDRATKPKKLFTAEQIQLLLDHASPAMKAMILLSINTGMNNADIGNMEPRHLVDDWLDYPRHKTGIERVAPLWPETLQAIVEYKKVRQDPLPQFERFLFVTKARRQWRHSSLPSEFRKLLDSVNGEREKDGRLVRDDKGKAVWLQDPPIPHGSFGYLRHTFQTRGEDNGDSVAVKAVMGHVDESISAEYREEVFRGRLQNVVDHVHGWLFGKWGGK